MPGDHAPTPTTVADSLARAMNDRDIEPFASSFANDYDSQQPAHPDRAFRGRDQVRENRSSILASVPDFRADLLDVALSGDTLGTERRWRRTHADTAARDGGSHRPGHS